MWKFLSVILFFGLTAPAIADECPMGYTPTKYTQLEYIESTGTQYIDTGYSFTKNEGGIKIKYNSLANSVAGHYQGVLGSQDSNYQNWFVVNYQNNNFRCGSSEFSNIVSINTINEQEIMCNNGHVSHIFNGISSSSNYSGTIRSGGNIYLFTYGVVNRPSMPDFFIGRLYYVKIYSSSTILVRNLIPAKRNNDGEIGMYDTVTGHFFTNAGTGEFIAGPETLMVITENTCFPCPPNTYKDFVGNGDCTPCPDTFSSPSGAKSINECGRILHIGDYVAHMPFGRRTEHGLCTMFDGKKYCADVYEKQ